MIRDRGRIKWTSMMLPEHVKLLRDWAKEDMYENKMEPDEQQLEVMNEVMAEAMEFGKSVAITYYSGRRYQIVIGTIHYWDEIAKKLHVIDRFDEVHQIEISNIADVRFADDSAR